MKITYLGNFLYADFSTENHVKKTLESMGHTVIALQEDTVDMDTVITTANKSDLFLWTRTYGFLKFNGFEMLFRIRVPKASFHLDLYAGISRELQFRNDPFWFTDIVFQPDGDPKSMEFFHINGSNAYYLPAGVFKDECNLEQPLEGLRSEIIFVGNYAYHQEHTYRQTLIDWLHNTYGNNFKRYGQSAPDQWNAEYVRGRKLNQVYASAKVVVGDSLCVGFKHANYWSDRVYETMGRGGFMIHPYIAGMEQEFTDRKHLVFYEFGNFEQLQNIIDYYRVHNEEREAIRLAGHKYVKENCTYHNRMETLLKEVEGVKSARRG